jgi:hypothetical protein
VKALDCEKCIFFPHLARIEKMPAKKVPTEKKKKKKEQAKSKKIRPHPNRGGAEIFKEFFSLVSQQPRRGLSLRLGD